MVTGRGLWSSLGVLLVFVFCQKPVVAQSETERLPWEVLSINVGIFMAQLESELRVNSQYGADTIIDLENTLGLDEHLSNGRLETSWRFKPRHRLYFTYFPQEREAARTIDLDIPIDSQEFAVNTVVNTVFSVDCYKGGYSYSFFQDDRFDLAIVLGVHLLHADLGLSSPLTGTVVSGGLKAFLAITPRFFVKQSLEFFSDFINVSGGSVSNYDGQSMVVGMDLEYNILEHFGIGMGYEYASILVEEAKPNLFGNQFIGELEYEYSGLKTYVKFYF